MHEPKKQPNRIFLREVSVLIIIKDYRAHKSNEFKTELRSSVHYVFKTIKQTILEAIIGAFERRKYVN